MNRAFLIGINAYPRAPLDGCVNDVMDMANFLISKCGFAQSDISILLDARANTAQIKDGLAQFIANLTPGDRVLFHYSGHGAQVPTRNPAYELDGLDEVICPVDFDWTEPHLIRDKHFQELFREVPGGVEFIWISDSCHSADLSRELYKQKSMIPPADIMWDIQAAKARKASVHKVTDPFQEMNLALISGCKSNQTAADASFAGRPNGALTRFLLDSLNAPGGMQIPLSSLIPQIRTNLLGQGYTQEPQIEGSPAIISKPFLAE